MTTLHKPIEISELASRPGIARILLSWLAKKTKARSCRAGEVSMGGYKRFALLVLVTIGACLFVGAFAGHPARAQTEPVIVGVPRDFYPEYAIGADDRPEGFGVDVMNAVAKRAGLSVTYRVFTTWSETLAALERGDIDVIPVVVITPARESRLLFTRPVLTSPHVHIRPAGCREHSGHGRSRRAPDGGDQGRPGPGIIRRGGEKPGSRAVRAPSGRDVRPVAGRG